MSQQSTVQKSTAIAGLLLAALTAAAEPLAVSVVDADGLPVAGVAVYVTAAAGEASVVARTAVMDQRDTQFVPHVLVVQKGTSVEFPNSDVVAHHVYSFSKPNNFVLPLYKGDPHNPVKFEHDGIVTLGCNIHDDMLAYIVVVDTNNFGITDENGELSIAIEAPAADSTVSIWSPRIRDKNLSQPLDAGTTSVTFSLQKKLRPPHAPGNDGLQWSAY